MTEKNDISAMAQTMAGRTAVISGSNSGIGAAIAIELSSRGANIVLNYPFAELEAACADIGKQLKTPWISVCADISTPEGPAALVAAAVSKFGQIDILVNNAARFPHGPADQATIADWDAAFNLNARGAHLLTQAALPHLTPFTPTESPPMIGHEGGARIICISSGTCRSPQSGTSVYSATKAALEAMVRSWALELPPVYGCTVNAVSPGPTGSTMLQKALTPDAMYELYGKATPAQGSVGEPEDISRTVAFLAESSTKWINGEIIGVNGGYIMI